MKYICRCCNFETTFKRNYVSHILTQKHINNFKNNKYCDICDKEYSTSKYFKIHYNREHSTLKNEIIVNQTNHNLSDTNNKINSSISYNKIKTIVDESNQKMKDDVKEEILDVKEEINKSNQEVVKVVNKAINRASSLIKYLMENHQTTPPLKKIKKKESIELLRIDYKCPLNNKDLPYELEKTFIYDYRDDMFVKNLSKSILNLVNYKNPEKQPIWNTDSSRYNYVIKTTINKWSEDKSGIKFTDYVIRPLLHYIKDLICIYRINELEKINVKKFTSQKLRDHFTYIQSTYKLENDIVCDKLIKDILKELSPHLRYLEIELEELEEKEKFDEENKENEDLDEGNKYTDNTSDSEQNKLDELEQIQDDLEKIINNNKFNLDKNDSSHDNSTDDNSTDDNSTDDNSTDDNSSQDNSSQDKLSHHRIYKKRTKPIH